MSSIPDFILECRNQLYAAKAIILSIPQDQRAEIFHAFDMVTYDYVHNLHALHCCSEDVQIGIGEKFKDQLNDLRDISQDIVKQCEEFETESESDEPEKSPEDIERMVNSLTNRFQEALDWGVTNERIKIAMMIIKRQGGDHNGEQHNLNIQW
eukprot:CAMPEP_0115027158 /NCGR_PEP_ID=MMETSP0216-20121206/35287_1 /TAXON_ID=223996 /ORGANISM="Protocruzia adherens, Strain Boccale" /LENGTH=152 /DNA_ID=CAMNT_0002402595 /DNA_START=3 /DNA_END=458 /DNA_ORIENTATION=+